MHTCEAKLYGQQRIEKFEESEERDSQEDRKVGRDEVRTPDLSLGELSLEKECGASLEENKDEKMIDQRIDDNSNVLRNAICSEHSNQDDANVSEKTRPGAVWDVFRRQDVPKVIEYLRIHLTEYGDEPNSERYDLVSLLIFSHFFILGLCFGACC